MSQRLGNNNNNNNSGNNNNNAAQQTSPPAPCASCWIRDVHEEGIEPHPGPAVYCKNVDGLNARFEDAMYRISQSHARKPMYAFLLQEHHLTANKAKDLEVTKKATKLGLLYVQADMPNDQAKGGTAVVIPLDMIKPHRGESEAAAIRRVATSAYTKPDGRMTSVTTLVNDEPMTFTSIYAPVDKDERPAFFTAIASRLAKNHVVGMDANCVFNPQLDVSRPSGLAAPEDTAGTPELHKALTDCDLTDIARETLGTAPNFTNNTVLQGGTDMTRKRIDHIHTPAIDSMMFTFKVNPPDILPYQKFGHTMLEIEAKIIQESRGKDLPFINEAIFDDDEFNQKVVTEIGSSMGNPASGEWGEAWERTKPKVTDMCLERTAELRRQKDEEAERIRNMIKLAKDLAQGSTMAANATLIATVRDLERQLHEHTTKRRSLHDMLEKEAYSNGEKHDVNTAAFHRQWTPKNSAQWVEELMIRDWTDPSNPQPAADGTASEKRHNHIATAFTTYYKPLYSNKPPQTSSTDHDGNSINPLEKALDTLRDPQSRRVLPPTAAKCGLPITPPEIEHTMSYLPKRKSPGPDRLPNQFYRTFAKPLSKILANVYNESKEVHHKLPETLRQGIISVLYKKKERDDPRNYRPITLLNNDYKILMRILAQRMNEAVVQFVSRDQNGFVPDGFIAENIMRLQLLQDLIEDEDDEALFIFLDMEKAFDRCSWDFLIEGLEAIGFDSTFIDYIKLAYSTDHPPTRQMYVNGFLGPSFELGSGVAQGCPISPLLFLIIAEPLTRLINNDANIKGITTDALDQVLGLPCKHKISQFADDSTLILRLLDMPYAFTNIRIWCEATSMRENTDKREVLLLGTLRGHPERLPNDLAQKVVPDGKSLRALGVPIGNDFDELHWWIERYRVVKARTTHWNGLSRLSITGRNILLQSILYGSLRYWFFTLCVPDSIIEMIESDAKELLWASNPELQGDEDGTANKSNRYIFKKASWLPQKKGGGSVMHLPSHTKAFQAQWIIKYLDPRDSPWKEVLDHWFANTDRLGRGTLLSSNGHHLRRRIPDRCKYLHACFDSFYELDLQQDLSLLSYRSEGEPLWKNPRFSIPVDPATKEEWCIEIDTYRMSDLRSGYNVGGRGAGYIRNEELERRISSHIPDDLAGRSSRRIRRWERERGKDIGAIRANVPREFKDVFKEELPDLEPGMIVYAHIQDPSSPATMCKYVIHFTDEEEIDQYEELFLDTSGYPHRTGKLIDTDDLLSYSAVSVWTALNKQYQEPYAGDPMPDERPVERDAIMGPYWDCFPLNEGWYAKGQTPRKDDGSPRRMSDLTIHEMTVIFTDRITKDVRPNCEHNWQFNKQGVQRLPPFKFKWSTIWGSLGTPLSDPTEEKSWRRLLHRAIDAKNRHPGNPDKACRLMCGCNNESMLHMVQCRYSRPFWLACTDFCKNVLGEKGDMCDITMVVIFNVDIRHKLLSQNTRAFLRHAVRWWYASLTAVKEQKKIFIWQACFHTTVTKFREAVIRTCIGIRKHYNHRRYTSLTGVVPEEERKRYAAVAKININGTYAITPALETAISRAAAAKARAMGS